MYEELSIHPQEPTRPSLDQDTPVALEQNSAITPRNLNHMPVLSVDQQPRDSWQLRPQLLSSLTFEYELVRNGMSEWGMNLWAARHHLFLREDKSQDIKHECMIYLFDGRAAALEPWLHLRSALESHWHVTHVESAKLAAMAPNPSVGDVSGEA